MPRKRRDVPWLEPNEAGVYYVHWYDAAKKRTKRASLNTEDPSEAAARFAAFLTEGKVLYKPESLAAVSTVNEVLDFYTKKHLDTGKVADKGRILSKFKHLRAHFGETQVTAIDDESTEAYVEKRTAGGLGRPSGPGTIRGELNMLEAAMNFCASKRYRKETGLLPDDLPFIDKPEAPDRRDRWLTREELAAVMAAAESDTRTYGFVMLSYYTASRRRAIETLTWPQWTEIPPRVQLNPTGRKQTRKFRPTVPADPMLKPVRQRLWSEFGTREYVLGSKQPIWAPMRQLYDGLGLTDCTAHTLRHSRATHLLQDGVSIFDVAGLLGDTVQMVAEVYGHHCGDHLESVLSKAKEM